MRYCSAITTALVAILFTVAYIYARSHGLLEQRMMLKDRNFDCSNTTVDVELNLGHTWFMLKTVTPGEYLFHAAMTGPQGEHFACFLEREAEGYSCKDLQYLDRGVWRVKVTLVRTCCRSHACPRHEGTGLSVLEYVLKQGIKTFKEFQHDFKYPYRKLLEFEWNATSSQELPVPHGIKCTHGSRGVWRPIDERCIPPACKGTIDGELVRSESNANRGMHHSFSPFNCSYFWFSKEEALQCLSSKRPLLVGDSRMRQLRQHAEFWLGTNVFGSIPLEFPHHFGLPLLLKSSRSAELFVAVANNRVVLMNSIVHDLADFSTMSKKTTTVDYRFYWNLTGCNGCNGKLATDCNCTGKHGALQEYLANVERLGKLLQQGLESASSGGESNLFWVSQFRSPPFHGTNFFSWQTHDFLSDLEERVVSLLADVPVRRLDLHSHVMAAPLAWWDDIMHYGRNNDSFFQHITLQVILNHICTVPL
jgi:hypothetical protein